MKIGPKNVVRDGPPLVMAEIGVNHDGSEQTGAMLVSAAAEAACDAVKFQLFRADLLLAREAGLVAYQEKSAGSAQELLSGLEMGAEVMGRLVKQAQGLGLAALVTPFSPDLVPACVEMGVDAIKLASPDLVNLPLVQAACDSKLPLILSTGGAELAEVERTVGWLYRYGALGGAGEEDKEARRPGDNDGRAVILHCVSSYPTPAERATLGAIAVLRQRFAEVPIGYSDHTTETFTAALAVGAGACVLEKHLTLDKKSKGPDHAASLEPHEIAEYAALARIAYAMRGPYAKQVLPEERDVRQQTRQSVVTRIALPAGTVLTREMLCVKRPGLGIPAADFERVIGRRLLQAVQANVMLSWDEIEGGADKDQG